MEEKNKKYKERKKKRQVEIDILAEKKRNMNIMETVKN